MPEILLHIGYPKTGSNFLRQYFNSNDKLFVEGSTFTDNYIKTGKISAELASKTEKHHIISEERFSVWGGEVEIVGVKFKPYDIKSHQKETCRSLKAAFPEAKVLIVLRGFKSALRSMYWQYVSIGGIFSFPKFQQNYREYFADFYDYDFLVRTYREVFQNKVILLPFELLEEDSVKFLGIMEDKCALPHADFTATKANASLTEKIDFYTILSRLIYEMIQPFPYSLQKKIYGKYANALYNRKLNHISKLFSRHRKLEIDEETLRLFIGKAEVVRNEKLFEPYREAYFLTD
ncbi:MAG TPA: hypothetical protein VNJ07_05620 [Chitinophagales bacterium]|nr:hypothetical protein [Chitinophagales bacterium]